MFNSWAWRPSPMLCWILFNSPFFFSSSHPARAFASLSARRSKEWKEWKSRRKLGTHGLKCEIPMRFLSTHSSRFSLTSALCRGMSAEAEKEPILESFHSAKPDRDIRSKVKSSRWQSQEMQVHTYLFWKNPLKKMWLYLLLTFRLFLFFFETIKSISSFTSDKYKQ